LRIFLAYISGIVITPMFLPYIPVRYFSLKGFYAGAMIFLILLLIKFAGNNFVEIFSWFLIITTISSFLAMNFTGSSTYTSLSGVKKEMKISVPFQIGFAFIGIILQVVEKIIY
jgi:acetyl-CoA decarbonylase/synthase complex subunit gamma